MRKPIWLLLLAAVILWGQSFTASIRGTVNDQTQAAVPGATVTVTEVNRNVTYKTSTNAEGFYLLPTLPPGTYTLAVEHPGFRKHLRSAFQLEVQQQATIDVELAVGDLATTVEVQGAAPLLNTASVTLGQVIENRLILALPLSGRNPLALAALTPGVVPAGGAAGGTSGVNFVSAGVRNSSADAMLDGTVITSIEQNGGVTDVKYTPSVDVIEEIKVLTNVLSAEFGNTGSTVINMVSKSGTNELHGVVYEFRRDNALNATPWFTNRAGGRLSDSKRDIFGGTIGGPVLIPGVYNGRSRTFFFYDFEGTRSKSFTSTQQSVPTAMQKAGDFSDTRRSNGALYPIYNPYDIYTNAAGTRLRALFPGNIIPPSLINPLSREMTKFYPEANREGVLYTRVNNWYAEGINESSSNKMDAKVDHHLGDNQRLSSRYSVNWQPPTKPANLIGNMAGSWSIYDSRGQNFVLDYTRTHNPTTIMTLRAGILRMRSFNRPGSYGFDSRTVGFPAILRQGGAQQFPGWVVSGYMTLGGGEWVYTVRGEHVAQLIGSVTKMSGRHTVKSGAEIRRMYVNYTQPSFPNGGFSFSRGVTGENPVVSNSNQGDGFASMLLGWGSGGGKWIDTPAATASGYVSAYVQDDWRITSKLTLNLGVRYDFEQPRTDRWNRLYWMDYDAPSPIAGKVPGLPGRELKGLMKFCDDKNRSPFAGDYNNIQPRIGIAYALGRHMSIRTGYGIFYTPGRHTAKGEVAAGFRSSSSITWSRDSGYTQYATLQNPFPDGLTPIRGRDAFSYVGFSNSIYDRYSKNQQYQQWNFSIQRTLPGDGVLEVNYTGSKGTYLYYGEGDLLGNRNKMDTSYWSLGRTVLLAYVPNPFYGIITDPLSELSLPTVRYDRLLRPYPHYGSLGGYVAPPNIGNSSYNSVQFKYEKRFSRGLAVVAHYTIAKMMGDTDSPGSDIDWLGGSGSIQNWKNLRLERSLSSFDIPQRAVISFNYLIPVGRGRALGGHMHKLLDGVVGGWEVSGTTIFSSGFPLAVGLASNNLLSGTQRPHLIGNPATTGPASQRIDGYFNVAAFATPGIDEYGTAPRRLSNYRRYGVRTGDMTLMKNFAIAERKSVQLRLEAYNVTNTPGFGAPNTTFGSSSFGLITSTSIGARSVQVAAKFYY